MIVLESRRNTEATEWDEVERSFDNVSAGLLKETANVLNEQLGWRKYRTVTVEQS